MRVFDICERSNESAGHMVQKAKECLHELTILILPYLFQPYRSECETRQPRLTVR